MRPRNADAAARSRAASASLPWSAAIEAIASSDSAMPGAETRPMAQRERGVQPVFGLARLARRARDQRRVRVAPSRRPTGSPPARRRRARRPRPRARHRGRRAAAHAWPGPCRPTRGRSGRAGRRPSRREPVHALVVAGTEHELEQHHQRRRQADVRAAGVGVRDERLDARPRGRGLPRSRPRPRSSTRPRGRRSRDHRRREQRKIDAPSRTRACSKSPR